MKLFQKAAKRARRACVLSTTLLLAAVFVGCDQGHHHETLASGTAEGSLYDLPTVLTDSTGQKVAFSGMHGQVQVASMIYTHCTTICPRIVADMKRIQDALPPAERARVRFLVVSMDERDTPEIRADYSRAMNLDTQWRVLGGKEGEVREYAGALGFQFRRTPDVNFVHSNQIYLLNEHGMVVFQKEGGGDAPRLFAAEIAKL